MTLASGCGTKSEDQLFAAQAVEGHWRLFLTPTGQAENGPTALYMVQNNTQLTGAGFSRTLVNDQFNAGANVILFTLELTGTADNANTISGTYSILGIQAGTFRLTRFTPDGNVTVNGTVNGQAVNITTNIGVGSRDYDDVAKTVLDEVEVIANNNDQHFEMDFTTTNLATGTLTVPGQVGVTVLWRDGQSAAIEVTATAGSLDINQYNNNGFAGTFTLTLPGGNQVTGSFNIDWDLNSYDP